MRGTIVRNVPPGWIQLHFKPTGLQLQRLCGCVPIFCPCFQLRAAIPTSPLGYIPSPQTSAESSESLLIFLSSIYLLGATRTISF